MRIWCCRQPTYQLYIAVQYFALTYVLGACKALRIESYVKVGGMILRRLTLAKLDFPTSSLLHTYLIASSSSHCFSATPQCCENCCSIILFSVKVMIV